MALQMLLEQIKRAIFEDPSTPHRDGHDPSGLIGQIEGLFGRHEQEGYPQGAPQQQYPGGQGQVLPASQDPYGDPADQQQGYAGNYGVMSRDPGGNIRPASEDPYGDPADQPAGGYPNIRPASEDPYGDPADQEPYRR